MFQPAFDYAAIRCGYTSRLIDDDGAPNAAMKAIEAELDCKIVYLDTESSVGRTAPYVVGEVGGLVESLGIHKKGVFIIEESDLATVMRFVSAVMEIGHCAFFMWETLYKQSFATVGNEAVMCLVFDTESG